MEYFAVSNQIPSHIINSSLRGAHILHLYTIVKQKCSFWPDTTLTGVEELTEEGDSLPLSTAQFLYQLSLISAEWQNNEGANGLLEKLIRLPRAMSREILSISKDKGVHNMPVQALYFFTTHRVKELIPSVLLKFPFCFLTPSS